MASCCHMLLFVGMICLQNAAEGYKILMYPINMKSHYIQMGEIATALLENNHRVHMLVPAHSTVPQGLDPNIEILAYPVSKAKAFTGSAEMNELMFELLKKSQSSFIEYTTFAKHVQIRFHEDLNQDCEDILNNANFFNKLVKERYDLVVLDSGSYVCPSAIIYKLGIPLVSTSLPFAHWFYGVPLLPSVSPGILTDSTDEMSFLQRVANLAHELSDVYFLNTTTYFIEKYVPEKAVKSSADVLRESAFWFYMYDSVLLYPRPSMPNTLEITGIIGRPGASLPEDYEKIMQTSTDGVILMALGSYFDYLPKEWVAKFCKAFQKINSKITILWKMKIKPDCQLSANVVIKSWIPQNDVLAHPKLRLFITHCGQSSYTEAVFHAKPMIAFPLSLDQPHNGLAMQNKGLGIRMNILNFTVDEMVGNINTVLSTPSYTTAAQNLSARMRHKPVPIKKRIAFWVEHVIQFGAEHLRIKAYKLSLFEFLMLDIIGVLLVSCVLCLLVAVCLCVLCTRICKSLFCRKLPKHKKE